MTSCTFASQQGFNQISLISHQLKFLNLSWVEGLTDFTFLQQFTELEELGISGLEINDPISVRAVLTNNRRLKKLWASNRAIGDKELQLILELSELERLVVAESCIKDEALLLRLVMSSNLCFLDLSDLKISNAVKAKLKENVNLEYKCDA